MEMMTLTGTLDYKKKNEKKNYTVYKKARIGSNQLGKEVRIYKGCLDAAEEKDSSAIYHIAKAGGKYHVFAVDGDDGRSVSDRVPIERRHGRLFYIIALPFFGVLAGAAGIPGGVGLVGFGLIGALTGIGLPPSLNHIETYLKSADSQD